MNQKINRQGTRDGNGNRQCDPQCRMNLTPLSHRLCAGERGEVGKGTPLRRSKQRWKESGKTISLRKYRRSMGVI